MGGFFILLFKYLFPKGHKYDGDQIWCWFNHSTIIDQLTEIFAFKLLVEVKYFFCYAAASSHVSEF